MRHLRQRWKARQERLWRERNPAAAEMKDLLAEVIARGPDEHGNAQITREEATMLKTLARVL